MKQVFLYLLFIFSSPVTLGLECYECYNAVDASTCKYHRSCGQNEHCAIQKSLDSLGEPRFHLMCMNDFVCGHGGLVILQPIGRRKRSLRDLQCCDTDLCNHELLPGSDDITTEMTADNGLTETMICKDHDECGILVDHFSVCNEPEVAKFICPRLCDKCLNPGQGTTRTMLYEQSTASDCQDNELCIKLASSINVCSHEDTATKLCPRMCNRCLSEYVAMTMTIDPCFDTNVNCLYLNKSLNLCKKPEVSEMIGCRRTCGQCVTVAEVTSQHVTDVAHNGMSTTVEIPGLPPIPVETNGVSGIASKSTESLPVVTSYTKTFSDVEGIDMSSVPTKTIQADGMSDITQFCIDTSLVCLLMNKTNVCTNDATIMDYGCYKMCNRCDLAGGTVMTTLPMTTMKPTCIPPVPDDGKAFLFMYEKNVLPRSSSLNLMISSNKSGWIVRSFPDDDTHCINITYDSGSTIVNVPNAFQMNNLQLEKKGVYFVSSGDISMQAMFQDPSATDGFLVLPVDQLSTAYVIPSYDPSGIFKSFIGVAAIEKNTTVTFKLKTTGSVAYEGKSYGNGSLLTIQMDKFDTFELVHDADLTGTQILSNKPIAVESGNQCANVPKDIGTCNHLLEMIPPITSLGQTYVVPPLHSEIDYLVRVVSAFPNTEVVININRTVKAITLTNIGDFAEFTVSGLLPVYVNTSLPALVARYGEGAVPPGEPFLSLVPSKERFKNVYDISVLYLPDFTHRLSIIVPRNDISCILIDGNSLQQFNSYNIYPSHDADITDSVVEVVVQPGHHQVTCANDKTKFGLIVFGVSDENSYGYQAGL